MAKKDFKMVRVTCDTHSHEDSNERLNRLISLYSRNANPVSIPTRKVDSRGLQVSYEQRGDTFLYDGVLVTLGIKDCNDRGYNPVVDLQGASASVDNLVSELVEWGNSDGRGLYTFRTIR
tara:strand:+ start:1488 stop:1847 length:360 start_codon:yes stop_codon:yes gene_type:complete